MNAENYLLELEKELLDNDNFQEIKLTNDWVSRIPNEPGVYVLKEKSTIIYVGETGSLSARMKDLLDSRHHSVRRTLGQKLFSNHKDFSQATIRSKFPVEIEGLLDKYIINNISLAIKVTTIGRKELEERIENKIVKESKLNKRGKRKSF